MNEPKLSVSVMNNVYTVKERRAQGIWGDGLFARVFDYIGEGVVVLEAGLILDVNLGAAKCLNLSKTALIGQRISRFLAPESRKEFEASMVLAADPPLKDDVECGVFRMRNAQGLPLIVEGSLTGDAHSGRIVYFFRDVTEYQRAEIEREKYLAQLLQAKGKAEAAVQLKEQWISNVTHEFRTPLHAILSFAGKGVEKAHKITPDRLHAYFEQIRCSGTRLLELVNELLNLSKMREGKFVYVKRPVDLASLFKSVAQEFEALLLAQRVELVVDAPEGLARPLLDQKMVRRVLVNLVANALRFSPLGGKIEMGLEWDPDQKGFLRVYVSDCGPGLPPDELEAIFEAFTQSSLTQNRQGGTGLGLAISREIIAEHGGRIWAQNSPTGGACFFLSLPVSPPLGELLLAKGVITDEHLAQALSEQKNFNQHQIAGQKEES
ncbi:MAG: PAS domain-containing sensor histidine kinase [bacterium]|nr:PAS domain-containing sensor histidine kinase [bacterium]